MPSNKTRVRISGAWRLVPVISLIAAPALAQPGSTIGLQRDPAIAAALGEIDPARIRAIDSTLVSFETRNTFSDTLSNTRGIGAARRWIYSQFQRYSRDCGGCLKVEYY